MVRFLWRRVTALILERSAPRIRAEIFGFPPSLGVTPRIALRIGFSHGLGCEWKTQSCSENALGMAFSLRERLV